MLPAQPIRNRPDLFVIGLRIAVILFSGIRMHRVEDNMRVDMLPVCMYADDSFITCEMFRRKRLSDIQR